MSDAQRADGPRNTAADDLETTAERRSGFLGADVLAAHRTPTEGGDTPDPGAEPASPVVDPAATTVDRTDTTTSPAPAAAHADAEEASTNGAAAADTEEDEANRAETAVLLAGASVLPGPRSRARAHVWGVVLSVLLLPLAWYLIADGGARLAPQLSEALAADLAGGLEFAAGLLVLAVVFLTARWSSVGVIVAGSLLVVLGVPFLVAPAWAWDLAAPVTEAVAGWHQLGTNAVAHFTADTVTGRLVLYGLALIVLGVVSHGARRQGRREEKARFDRARNREIASRRMAENRRRTSEYRFAEVERRGTTPTAS